MMNFSGIPRDSVRGKLLRLLLTILPPNTIVPVIQGTLRGKRWIVGSGVHGYWLGSFELEKQRAIIRQIAQGGVFYDIGANVGFYTLFASQLVGPRGSVYAFEPLPRNVAYLRKHIALNRLKNVNVMDVALTNYDGVVSFSESKNPAMGKIASDGNLAVTARKLDSLVENDFLRPPQVLKIDIEGAEYQCMLGAAKIIESLKPIIFLATHGRDIHLQCLSFLNHYGYKTQSLDELSINETNEILAY